jgi:hypothetical protein
LEQQNIIKKEVTFKEETKDLMGNILEKIKKNTEPIINNVLKQEEKEEKEEKEEIKQEDNNIPEVEIEKLRMSIEKLEKAKELTEDAIYDFTNELDQEEKYYHTGCTNLWSLVYKRRHNIDI